MLPGQSSKQSNSCGKDQSKIFRINPISLDDMTVAQYLQYRPRTWEIWFTNNLRIHEP